MIRIKLAKWLCVLLALSLLIELLFTGCSLAEPNDVSSQPDCGGDGKLVLLIRELNNNEAAYVIFLNDKGKTNCNTASSILQQDEGARETQGVFCKKQDSALVCTGKRDFSAKLYEQ